MFSKQKATFYVLIRKSKKINRKAANSWAFSAIAIQQILRCASPQIATAKYCTTQNSYKSQFFKMIILFCTFEFEQYMLYL